MRRRAEGGSVRGCEPLSHSALLLQGFNDETPANRWKSSLFLVTTMSS